MTEKQEKKLFKLLTDIDFTTFYLWTLKKIEKDKLVKAKRFNK